MSAIPLIAVTAITKTYPYAMQNKFQQMVAKLIKSPTEIFLSLTADGAALIHSGMGVCGEAGELIDAIKKHTIYLKPLDRENVIEELGDLEFYMEDIRRRIHVTRDEVLQANMDKLAKRYGPNFEYTNQKARDRADKNDSDSLNVSSVS